MHRSDYEVPIPNTKMFSPSTCKPTEYSSSTPSKEFLSSRGSINKWKFINEPCQLCGDIRPFTHTAEQWQGHLASCYMVSDKKRFNRPLRIKQLKHRRNEILTTRSKMLITSADNFASSIDFSNEYCDETVKAFLASIKTANFAWLQTPTDFDNYVKVIVETTGRSERFSEPRTPSTGSRSERPTGVGGAELRSERPKEVGVPDGERFGPLPDAFLSSLRKWVLLVRYTRRKHSHSWPLDVILCALNYEVKGLEQLI